MAGGNIPSKQPHAGFSWLALWLVLALLLAAFGGWSHVGHDEHAGHDHGPAQQHACVVCLLSHGSVVADGGVGHLMVFVLALVFAAFIAEVRPVCFARLELPLTRGPPI